MFITLILININCNDNSLGPIENVDNTNYVVSSTFSFNVPVVSQSKLRLEGVTGKVIIIGTTQTNSVIVTGEKRVASESIKDAELHMSELSVIMQNLGNEITFKTIQPEKSYGRSYIVDYFVYVPNNFEISNDMVNGNIQVESISNNVAVSNVNGTVTLNNIIGSTTVSLVNGLIESNQTLPLNGNITLSTVNGGIKLSIPQNTSAEFSGASANGSVILSNLSLQNSIITTHSVQGRLGSGQGKVALSGVNGNINIVGF